MKSFFSLVICMSYNLPLVDCTCNDNIAVVPLYFQVNTLLIIIYVFIYLLSLYYLSGFRF